MSRIVSLQSTNYKRLKAVRIEPDQNGNLVVIGGKNGQGKSSILDSITAALGGVNAKTTPKPIRDGEERAEIILETEDLVVIRRFTASGTTLTVKSPDGAVYPKGQAKLDDLLGKLSLDPLAFTQLDDKQQLQTLLGLVELPFDPVVLDLERRTFFDQRTAVNRSLKELEARLIGHEVKEGDPVEEVSVNDLLNQIEAARAIKRDYDADVRDLAEAEDEVARLKRELAEATTHLKSMAAAVEKWQGAQLPDVAALTEQVANAEQTNRAARANAEWLHVKKQRDDTKATSEKLTKEIESIDKRRADGLAAAVFPVDELGFDESGVTFKGVPFKQASSAEQLRVSLAMAIALNPKLRVIRIADGSLLDSDNLALIESIAREHDFQVWIEMVGDGEGRGIIIEDGEVKQ
jgi:energy-coupling factor transporter ATP-binding protein EcfA2